MNRFSALSLSITMSLGLAACCPSASSAAEVIPHAQDKPPGPPLSPAEAIAR